MTPSAVVPKLQQEGCVAGNILTTLMTTPIYKMYDNDFLVTAVHVVALEMEKANIWF